MLNPLPSQATLIFNPVAGRSRASKAAEIQVVANELESSGMSITLQQTSYAVHAEVLARDAIRNGAQLIIVCGGDGTINEAVCGMAHSSVPLAILPGGTANVLAREIGLPMDIPSAAKKLLSCTPRRLSLGLAGSRYFLLMTGVGFDARVIHSVSAHHKKAFGMATYIFEALRQGLFHAPVPFVLKSAAHSCASTFACIAKARHYGPIKMVREADLYSNQFFVYCFHSRSRFRYILYALALLSGNLHRLSDVSRFAAAEILCEPSPAADPVFLQVDGELVGPLPCKISIVPDALTLLVPSSHSRKGGHSEQA